VHRIGVRIPMPRTTKAPLKAVKVSHATLLKSRRLAVPRAGEVIIDKPTKAKRKRVKKATPYDAQMQGDEYSSSAGYGGWGHDE
jgi:hypothetical protein